MSRHHNMFVPRDLICRTLLDIKEILRMGNERRGEAGEDEEGSSKIDFREAMNFGNEF